MKGIQDTASIKTHFNQRQPKCTQNNINKLSEYAVRRPYNRGDVIQLKHCAPHRQHIKQNKRLL